MTFFHPIKLHINSIQQKFYYYYSKLYKVSNLNLLSSNILIKNNSSHYMN